MNIETTLCAFCENVDSMLFERYERQINIETTLCAFCENVDSMSFERYERQMSVETKLCAFCQNFDSVLFERQMSVETTLCFYTGLLFFQLVKYMNEGTISKNKVRKREGRATGIKRKNQSQKKIANNNNR